MILGNTQKRIITAFIAIPLIVLIVLAGKEFFLIFTLGIGLFSYYEFHKISENKNFYSSLFIGLISTLMIILNFYYSLINLTSLILIITFSLLLYELFKNKNSAIANIGTSLFGILYIGFFSSSILLLREFYKTSSSEYINGGYLVLSVLISIWLCDSAAFFIGTKFGKHKLFPRVSPKKSWEGSIGGLAFTLIGIFILHLTLLNFLSLTESLIIGFLIGIFGQLGDLIESLIKRDANVKDSSNIIPGHGGILDRFDSLLFTSPIVYIFINYFC